MQGDTLEDCTGQSVLLDSDSVESCAADVVLRMCLRCIGNFPVFLSELQVNFRFNCWPRPVVSH